MSKIFILFVLFKFMRINTEKLQSHYSSSFVLSNNDIFLVLDNGIYVYDSTLSNIKNSHNFTSSQTITSSNDAETISISQYSTGNDSDNIILALVKNVLFIFTNEGQYLFEFALNSYLGGRYYSLIPYKYELSYYYIISNYLNGKISIQYFNLSLNSKENSRLSYIEYAPMNSLNTTESIMYYGLSCEIMIASDNKDVLSCFYQSNNPTEFGVSTFEITDTSINPLDSLRAYSSNDRAQIIKSTISRDKKNAFICFVKGYENGTCLNYNIDSNIFTNQVAYFNKCRGNAIGIYVYYFKEKNEYVFICSDNDKGFKIVIFNENFEPINIENDDLNVVNYKYGGNCYTIRSFSIIYIPGENDYSIINDCHGSDGVFTNKYHISNLLGGNNSYPNIEEIVINYNENISTEKVTEIITNSPENTSTEKVTEIITNSLSIITQNIITSTITNQLSESILLSMVKTENLPLSEMITDKITTKSTNIQNNEITDKINSQITVNSLNTEFSLLTYMKTNLISNKIEYTGNNTILNSNLNTQIYDNPTYITYIDNNKDKKNSSLIIETTSKKREEIINELDKIMEDKEVNKTYIIKGDDFSIIIKPVNGYIEESTVNIDFSECEKILKQENPSSDFIFLQINMENSNQNCLTDQVEYKVYNEKKESIDLSSCKDVQILIEYEIKNLSLLNIQEISNFKDKGIDVFNIKDIFFNDLCYPYSDNNSNSDMVLSDRVSDIYQNYSLCGEECEYESFNLEKMSANCNCKVKQEVNPEIEEGNFGKYIESSFLDSNFGVVKCYNLVFSLNGKLDNYGFFIFAVMTIIHIPVYILYCINGLNPVKKYIIKEMNKKGYEPKNYVINDNKNNSKYYQETTNQKFEINKKIPSNNNMNKRHSLFITRPLNKYNGNPPKKERIMNNLEISNNNDKNINYRNQKWKIIKQNTNLNNNLILKINNLSEDNSNKHENKNNLNKRKSVKSIIRIRNIDEINGGSKENDTKTNLKKMKEDSGCSSEKEIKFNEIINLSKKSINKRNRKSVKFSFKTFDLFNKIKNKQTQENFGIRDRTTNKENENKNKNEKIRRYKIIKNNNLISLESDSILNRKDKLIKINDKSIQKNSNVNFILNSNRHKSTILTKETISAIKSFANGNETDKKENLKKDKELDYPLIRINANNIEEYFPLKSKYVLDNYDYQEALIYDKRKYFRIFFIFLISKDNLLNIIFFNPPLELKPLRFSIFIFSYALDIALNAFFYLSDNISEKYQYKGKNRLYFSIINNIIISFVSTLVSYFLILFFQSLTQSTNKIEKVFRDEEDILKNDKNYKVKEITKIKIENEVTKILKCLKIKIFCFIIFEILILLFFFYYVTAFCEVYKSTQISWLLDCVSSYCISILITLVISFLFSLLYKTSIKYKMKFLYNLSLFVYSFW